MSLVFALLGVRVHEKTWDAKKLRREREAVNVVLRGGVQLPTENIRYLSELS